MLVLLLNHGINLFKIPALPCLIIHTHLGGSITFVQQCPYAIFPYRQMDQMIFDCPACRIGQLGPLHVRWLSNAPAQLGDLLQHAAERSGIRAGDVKPSPFVNRLPMAELVLGTSEWWQHE